MDKTTNIYKKAELYVVDLFGREQHPNLTYHNLEHTETVVSRTKEIAAHYNLDDTDTLALLVAAWFHDTGYLFVPGPEHEMKSVELMTHFATEYELPQSIVDKAAGCILATRRDKAPEGLLQEIIVDADTYDLGTKAFKSNNKNIFNEVSALQPETTQASFDEKTISLMGSHKYYTDYCKDLLKDGKKKNIRKLRKRALKNVVEKKKMKLEEDGNTISEKAGTTKGMQTMLRLTSSNHIQLSEMADSKANILISVNSIIISIILSVLIRKLETEPQLIVPAIIFLTATVITIVLAILATRPKVNEGTFNEVDVVNKKTNLLFFGNFHKMSLKNYEDAMRIMMQDADYLYSSMVQDIYHLGVVLGKKYKLIRMAYTVFMVGIVISVIAFAIATITHVPPEEAVPTNSTNSPF